MKEFKSIATLIAILFMICLTGAFLYYVSNSYEDKQIRISSNAWIGFTPYIYAQEMGWVDDKKFKFLWQVDWSESASLYERGLTHGFTASQYELQHIKENTHLKPLFLIDKSNGADAALSNFSLEELQKYEGNIEVYLEMASINEDFFSAFVSENNLKHLKFKRIDSDQQTITKLKWKYEPFIALTYTPYINQLTDAGFKIIASTATLKTISVIDGLFTDERHYAGREEDFEELNQIFHKAKKVMDEDPRGFYRVVKNYLEGQSYEHFKESTKQIEWVTDKNIAETIKQIQAHQIDTYLIKI